MSDGKYRNSGFDRIERDFYPTPCCYIEWLLSVWKPKSNCVLEPCAGNFAMVNALREHGYIVTGSDISTGQDALDIEDQGASSCIITNTPYGRLGPKIARHLIDSADQVALLFPYDWDAAGSRSDMFSIESAFAMKININQRVKWIEGSKCSGMHNYAWYIWDQDFIRVDAKIRQAPKN